MRLLFVLFFYLFKGTFSFVQILSMSHEKLCEIVRDLTRKGVLSCGQQLVHLCEMVRGVTRKVVFFLWSTASTVVWSGEGFDKVFSCGQQLVQLCGVVRDLTRSFPVVNS